MVVFMRGKTQTGNNFNKISTSLTRIEDSTVSKTHQRNIQTNSASKTWINSFYWFQCTALSHLRMSFPSVWKYCCFLITSISSYLLTVNSCLINKLLSSLPSVYSNCSPSNTRRSCHHWDRKGLNIGWSVIPTYEHILNGTSYLARK